MTAPSSRGPSDLRQKDSFGRALRGEAIATCGAAPWALGPGPSAPTPLPRDTGCGPGSSPVLKLPWNTRASPTELANSRDVGSACPASLGWRLAQGRDEQGEQVTSMSGSSLYEDLLLCVPPPAPSRYECQSRALGNARHMI